MRTVTVRLREFQNHASTTEKSIIQYILANPRETTEISVHELAEKTFSSPASVIRLCKKTGFDGYKDFCKALIYELALRENTQLEAQKEVSPADSLEEIVDKITYKNIVSLEATKDLIDLEVISQCIQLLYDCDHVALFGIGSSLLVAKDAQLKFMRLDKRCSVNDDWHTQLLTARNMRAKDVGIILSYSGQTREMVECAKAMKANGVKIISITRYGRSPVTEHSDLHLYVSATEGIIRSGAMSSRISQLNIIDILYTGYLNTQYEKSLEQIAKTHIQKGNGVTENDRSDKDVNGTEK